MCVLIIFVLAFAAQAYQGQAPGISAVWDIRTNTADLAASVRKLEPLLGQTKPVDWIARGASSTYLKQADSSRASLQALLASTDRLVKEPERLTAAIDTYFAMERVGLLLNSLKEGVRRYGNPALADEYNLVLAENSVHREKLKQHIQDLAVAREQEFRIMDQEAQRCRESLSQEAPDLPKSERRKYRTHD